MLFSDETKCHICKRIFCCVKCRQKHQFEAHAIAVTKPIIQNSEMGGHGRDGAAKTTTIYVFCPICEQKPLALREDMYDELLAHIESVHLPLRCRKCLRHYTKIEDLKEFSRCVDLGQDCSASSVQNSSSETETSKSTVKKENIAANTISTQTSPNALKDFNKTQILSPISQFNLRWKAKSRLTQDEFTSDSVSSIDNLSQESVNFSTQQRRSIGQIGGLPDNAIKCKGKVIRSTSTPLQVGGVFAKPKQCLTFNASAGGGGHVSSICHSGYVLDEQNTGPPVPPDNSNLLPTQQQQRNWKVGARGKMSAVTPLRQVMSKSIQKAFVEHGAGMLQIQGDQRRPRPDLGEQSSPNGASPLDLRLSPVVRRTQSEDNSCMRSSFDHRPQSPKPYQILVSAQKLTRESIVITRTQHPGKSGSVPASTTSISTTSTVYNSCESVEIITSASNTVDLGVNVQQTSVDVIAVPPKTPITSVPGCTINKKLIKFETPQKEKVPVIQPDDSTCDEKELFYTPNPSSSPANESRSAESDKNKRLRQQIVPRQLSGQFTSQPKPAQAPQGPRARPPLRTFQNHKSFRCVDIGSDDEDEVFLPNSASTRNDKKKPGRLWSLVSSVMRLPQTLPADENADEEDKENTATTSVSGSLIKRCASIAGSLVRTIHSHHDPDMQVMKRKRTQTLDSVYRNPVSPSNSSKRVRIQPRQPIDRMRNS